MIAMKLPYLSIIPDDSSFLQTIHDQAWVEVGTLGRVVYCTGEANYLGDSVRPWRLSDKILYKTTSFVALYKAWFTPVMNQLS